jgi:hypothetical protein
MAVNAIARATKQVLTGSSSLLVRSSDITDSMLQVPEHLFIPAVTSMSRSTPLSQARRIEQYVARSARGLDTQE